MCNKGAPLSRNARARLGPLYRHSSRNCLAGGMVALLMLTGCTGLQTCGDVSARRSEPRIRSSRVKMLLADPDRVGARFAPFAAMSALVYEDLEDCLTCSEPKMSANDHDTFEAYLRHAGWSSDHPGLKQPSGNDSLGTFFRVWSRETDSALEVVVAFRGTEGGLQDWINGNLRWVTRIFPGEDQYQVSRRYMRGVLDYFQKGAGTPAVGKRLSVFTTGHSLGGGLAQNALYTFPSEVLQAFAFDPSPVTGFADNSVPIKRMGCSCKWSELGGEARVYRIFDRKEILAKARLLLKLPLPLNRQIQEIRFEIGAGHSIAKLARHFIAAKPTEAGNLPARWDAGLGDAMGSNCSQLYLERLEYSCSLPSDWDYCPR